MVFTREQLNRLVEDELVHISRSDLLERVKALLIEPVLMKCAWEYGVSEELYPCWKVACDASRGVAIVRCEEGFGPKCPWGLVWDEIVPSMGQDCSWFMTFREAAADMLDVAPALLDVRSQYC